jgi:hypothetical protein
MEQLTMNAFAMLKSVPTAQPLPALVTQWLAAKAAESKAATDRLAVEQQIAGLLRATQPEDRQKADVDGLRVTVQYKVTRKVDGEALRAAWDTISPRAQSCFKWAASVDMKEMRKVADVLPADYALAAKFIESKPAKPSVTVEAIDDKEAA